MDVVLDLVSSVQHSIAKALPEPLAKECCCTVVVPPPSANIPTSQRGYAPPREEPSWDAPPPVQYELGAAPATGAPVQYGAHAGSVQQAEQAAEVFDTHQSTVGPLPSFAKPAAGVGQDPSSRSDVASSAGGSSVASHMLPEAGQSQGEQVDKATIKQFVKDLVRGAQYTVVSTSGDFRQCTVAISKKLTALKISAGGETRKLPLALVTQVYVGKEPADIETPLDDHCTTLSLNSGECITFRLQSIRERNVFAMCLQLFSDNERRV